MTEVNPQRRWTQRRDGPRALKAEETRHALIEAARALFAEHGYHEVGIRDLTAQAGVTRGALAHHFADKEGLFVAVFEHVERELIAEIADHAAAQAHLDPWAQFRSGLRFYLQAATRPDVQRITLIDGPAVLGWLRWRQLEEALSLGSLSAVLQAAMDKGLIRKRPVEPLAHLIHGSVMEAALMVANSEHPDARSQEVGEALDDLLGGLV
ncbi:MAG: TetR/AcrR family transcriptional regulator [Caulobacter sp.]